MIKGTFTALITPFKNNSLDYDGLASLVEFQVKNGISGILAVGTTGESPVLSWKEHNAVIEQVARSVKDKCLCIAGTGSNNTAEAIEATAHAAKAGADAVLLVEPYYNGPSSLEIRREYMAPVAKAFPKLQIIPYVIPGRSGTQLYPEDLAMLNQEFDNVSAVKDASGSIENMKQTRKCCGSEFSILSGDDSLNYEMMTNPDIMGNGVVSVAANIAPKAMSDMVNFAEAGEHEKAKKLCRGLEALFGLVTVKTKESTPFGEVVCRARNPLATKVLMAILGMPSGSCRPPLGKLTPKAMNIVLEAVRRIMHTSPEILEPAAEFFNIDIEARINSPDSWKDFCYMTY